MKSFRESRTSNGVHISDRFSKISISLSDSKPKFGFMVTIKDMFVAGVFYTLHYIIAINLELVACYTKRAFFCPWCIVDGTCCACNGSVIAVCSYISVFL